MQSYVKGEIRSNEFVQFVGARIDQMENRKIVLSKKAKKRYDFLKNGKKKPAKISSKVVKLMSSEEIGVFIRKFYEENTNIHTLKIDQWLMNEGLDDEDDGYNFIMFEIQKELTHKGKYEKLSKLEKELHLAFSNDHSKQEGIKRYSDEFTNLFKSAFKKAMKYHFHFLVIDELSKEELFKSINIGLESVVQCFKDGETERSERYAKKIALHISQNNKGDFWLMVEMQFITSVILALTEEVLLSKKGKIDMFTILIFLEDQKHTLKDYFGTKEDLYIFRDLHRKLCGMIPELQNQVVNDAINSVKSRIY